MCCSHRTTAPSLAPMRPSSQIRSATIGSQLIQSSSICSQSQDCLAFVLAKSAHPTKKLVEITDGAIQQRLLHAPVTSTMNHCCTTRPPSAASTPGNAIRPCVSPSDERRSPHSNGHLRHYPAICHVATPSKPHQADVCNPTFRLIINGRRFNADANPHMPSGGFAAMLGRQLSSSLTGAG